MRLKVVTFFSVAALCAFAAHAGFLAPTEFPKVMDDMSFIDRMSFKTEDYDAIVETVYDENGKCVSGCAYSSLNFEDELAAMERWDAAVKEELISEYDYTENEDGSFTPPEQDVPVYVPNGYGSVSFPSDTGAGTQNVNCAVHNTRFGNRDIPYGSPLGYVSCITSPYGKQRKLSWYDKPKIHRGVDLAARVGMPIYAPANGVVETVFRMNATCGNGIILRHPRGHRTKYCHLSTVSVARGAQVSAGCLIGKTGNTGPSTGPHLHYAVDVWNGTNYQPTNPTNFMEPHRMCR